MAKIIITLLVLFVCSVSCLNELPEFLHICKKNDPRLKKCFRESVLSLKPYFKEGVAKYNIPKTEPLILKDLLVSEPTGPNAVKISANNIKVFGCSDYDVRKLDIDFEGGRINFDVILKHLFIDGQYSLDGRILLFPVRGSGKVIGNFTNCIGTVKADCSIVKKNGDEYISVNTMDMKIQVGKGSIHLFNLFGGENVLGEVINDVINQNFDTFSQELFPAIERELSKLFIRMTNNIVSQYTYAQLFPTS